MMERIPKSDQSPEKGKTETAITQAWKEAESFITSAGPVLLSRIVTYAENAADKDRNLRYEFRTLAAAMELGVTDRNTDDYLAGIVLKLNPDTDPDFAQKPDENPRERLSRLMIAHDWHRITGTRPEISSHPLERDDIESIIGEPSDSERRASILILNDLAALIRTGSIKAMDTASRIEALSHAASLLPEFIRSGVDSLKRELDIMMTPDKESNPSDWMAPNAVYGLFMLSDAKTIREYLSGNTR